ncbi:MAG: hypothetical protein AAF502_20425 [Bacteroidota bacterium]
MRLSPFFSFLVVGAIIMLLANACTKEPVVEPPPPPPDPPPGPVLPFGTTHIEASQQREGDPAAGRDYLVNGDYVSSGIPYLVFKTVFGDDNENLLERTGDNATIPHDYTAVNHANGAKVVSANCMQCHAQKINGQYILGLGNSLADFTGDASSLVPAIDAAVTLFHGNPSQEWDAYTPFRQALLAVGPHLQTEVRGVNTADMLGAVLASHRDPVDLAWSDTPLIPVPPTSEMAPTDVPAWWLLKKKNAMFYAGVGRGDFAKFLMASSLLTLSDTTEARAIDNRFADVLAFIRSIEPPTYDGPVDVALAEEGKALFELNCSKCHGTYGAEETYPNLLVDLEVIGTDSFLTTTNFSSNRFVDWYNSSWFATDGEISGLLEVGNGYIAPPLDGVWATAPYLHNGSVPTIEDLLNSSQRPVFWRRSFDTSDYDHTKVGWNYSVETGQTDILTYDTTLPGYSNSGHTFGDHLSQADRTAVIEYLKTL